MQNNQFPSRKNHHLPTEYYADRKYYFITIVTQDRKCLFGDIKDGEMILNTAGRMVKDTYIDMSKEVEIVADPIVVVMPNHIHFLLFNHDGETPNVKDFVQAFKRKTTNLYIRGVKSHQLIPFDKKVWQRDYYDRIVRNQRELNYIHNYIYTNPMRWDMDLLNEHHGEEVDNINDNLKML